MPTYRIPDRWLQGYMRSGHTLREAIAHWLEQERLQRLWDAQHLSRKD